MPAPLDVPITPIDGGPVDVSTDVPVMPVDTGTPGSDAFEAGETSVEAEAGEAAGDAGDASETTDAYGERDAVAADSSPE